MNLVQNNKLPRYYYFMVLWSLFFAASTALAWPGENLLSQVNKLHARSRAKISHHAFKKTSMFLHNDPGQEILRAIREGHMGLKVGVNELVAQQAGHGLMKVKFEAIDPEPFSFLRQAPSLVESTRITYSLGGVDFCRYEAKAHRHADGRISINGKTPVFADDQKHIDDETWPFYDESWTQAKIPLEEMTPDGADIELISAKKCYELIGDEIQPLWEFVGRTNGKSYTILSDEIEVFEFEPLFFEAVLGQVQAYTKNPVDGNLGTYELTFNGDGYMHTEYFETNTNSAAATAEVKAYSEEHSFIYSPMEPEFAEASVFTHATNMLSYFQKLGYEWNESSPIILRVHALLGTNPEINKNNALYEPPEASANSQARISIGDGDNKVLKNLALDSDVVSHEFGHHIVFKTLKTTAGESLVLHEGLADFFTFSKSGDTCLGESICPANSNACMIPETCLRSASNDLMYNSRTYLNLGAHLRGQLVSGFLWDLRNEIDPTIVTNIVYDSLKYLVRDSGYEDLVISMLLADRDLTESENACQILSGARSRGLSTLLEGLTCENPSSWELPVFGKTRIKPTKPVVKNDNSGDFGCGTISSHSASDSSANLLILLLLFLFPIAFTVKGYRR